MRYNSAVSGLESRAAAVSGGSQCGPATWSSHLSGAYRDNEAYHFQMQDYDNGLNGCVDPLPFMTGTRTAIQQLTDAEHDPKQKGLLMAGELSERLG